MKHKIPFCPSCTSWKNFREHLRYRIDQVFARGSFAQLILLAVATLLAILLGMSAYFFGLFSEQNKAVPGIGQQIDQGFYDTLWWSAKHVFDPSFFDSNYGATWPVLVVSLVMTIMGMTLFATLLGFISNAIDSRMAELLKGNSAVKECNHLLILGWNDKIYSILNLLEDKQEDVKVVILSHYGIEQMNEFLRVRSQRFRHARVILRTGSPNNLVELQRVAFDSAFNIIVLADESSENQHETADIRVIKTLMLLAANREWKSARPKMVAEIREKHNLRVAEIAADNQVTIICSSLIMSKVIVQTSRQPGLSRVYTELFGFAGNEIYIRDFPACSGHRFGDIRACFMNAIPIGVSRMRIAGDHPVYDSLINPGSDYVVAANEWIICIAHDGKIKFAPSFTPLSVSVAAPPPMTREPLESILILGWSDLLYDMLKEFDSYMTAPTKVLVAAMHGEEHAMALMQENLNEPLKHLIFEYRRVDYIKQNALAQLPIGQISNLIILADKSSNEPDPDSRTIMTLLLLRDTQSQLPEHSRARIVAEVLNPDNCELLQHEKNLEFVVSPMIVSMLLTQLAQQLMLKTIYEDLLSAGGHEIYLKPVRRYTNQPENCTFDDIVAAAAGINELVIGVQIGSENEDQANNFGIHINPPRGKQFVFTGEDKVIVVAQDLYDPA